MLWPLALQAHLGFWGVSGLGFRAYRNRKGGAQPLQSSGSSAPSAVASPEEQSDKGSCMRLSLKVAEAACDQ